jgi:hypothetical protein
VSSSKVLVSLAIKVSLEFCLKYNFGPPPPPPPIVTAIVAFPLTLYE